MKFSASVLTTLFVVWISEIAHEISLYCIRTMNGVILWYVLTLQRFFVDFTTCLGIVVSLPILKIKQWSRS